MKSNDFFLRLVRDGSFFTQTSRQIVVYGVCHGLIRLCIYMVDGELVYIYLPISNQWLVCQHDPMGVCKYKKITQKKLPMKSFSSPLPNDSISYGNDFSFMLFIFSIYLYIP